MAIPITSGTKSSNLSHKRQRLGNLCGSSPSQPLTRTRGCVRKKIVELDVGCYDYSPRIALAGVINALLSPAIIRERRDYVTYVTYAT